MVDNIKNFAYSTVQTAPSPSTTGTSMILQTGDGSKFPTGPFNATCWPPGVIPLLSNAEIVRCSVAGDTVTMTRAQEGTSEQSIAVGWQFAQTLTQNLMNELSLAFDAAGSAAQAQTNAEAYTVANALLRVNNFADLTNTVVARANLGLGSAALSPSTAFDAAGLAAAEQTRAMAAELVLTNTKASLAGPVFTGAPTAPTPPPGTNTTQLATTAFVEVAVGGISGAGVTSFNSRTGSVTLLKADVTSTGLAASDVGAAPINNPTFIGIPAAPTPSTGNNSTQIATTAFVQNTVSAISSGVASFNGRSGVVTLQKGDITGTGLTYTDVGADAAGAATTAAQLMWPINSIFFSAVSTNPHSLLGFGSWQQVAQGLVLMGVGTTGAGGGGPATDVNGATMTVDEGYQSGTITGEYAHQLTAAQSGVPQHVHPISDPAEPYQGSGWVTESGGGAAFIGSINPGESTDNLSVSYSTTITGTGDNAAVGASGYHNNVAPYFGLYVWVRTG